MAGPLAYLLLALVVYTSLGVTLLISLPELELPLYKAAASGDTARVTALLASKASPHAGLLVQAALPAAVTSLLGLVRPQQPRIEPTDLEQQHAAVEHLLGSCSVLEHAPPQVYFRRPLATTSPLWIACERGHLDSVTALLAAGAAPDLGFSAGPCGSIGWSTPLHVAVVGGHVKIVSALLAAGADALAGESAGPWGWARMDSPLSTALFADVPRPQILEVMEVLLAQGKVDPSIRGSVFFGMPGPSPLEEAEDEERGHPKEFARLLRRYTPDAAAGQEVGDTATKGEL